MAGSEVSQSPEAETMRTQIAKLLERAISNLPEAFRPVFVLREIEGLSVEETAEALQIPAGTVKTRLLRSRRILQRELDPEIREALRDTFPFAGRDCDVLTERVLANFCQARPRNCERRVMSRQAVSGVSIVLLLVVVGALIAREKCRLGAVHWHICTELGFSTVGGPFPEPTSP